MCEFIGLKKKQMMRLVVVVECRVHERKTFKRQKRMWPLLIVYITQSVISVIKGN